MGKTSIEWTDRSWPIINGCRRISPGCENCYAEGLIATRLRQQPKYKGLAVYTEHGSKWTGESRLWPPHLDAPLLVKKPSRVFVADMGDLFYEDVTNEEIAAIFGVMAACPQHTFQVLTKRAKRMRQWFEWVEQSAREANGKGMPVAARCLIEAQKLCAHEKLRQIDPIIARPWPLPNVHLGVSVENQKYADERIPWLLATPAAVRFVSYEPALGPVDFTPFLSVVDGLDDDPLASHILGDVIRDGRGDGPRKLSWIIVGGESGRSATDVRPFDLAWARSLSKQCKAHGCAYFFKQAGRLVVDSAREVGVFAENDERSIAAAKSLGCEDDPPNLLLLWNRKGSEVAELLNRGVEPEILRREYPKAEGEKQL